MSRPRKPLGKGLQEIRDEAAAGRHPVDDLDAFLAAHPHVKVKHNFGPAVSVFQAEIPSDIEFKPADSVRKEYPPGQCPTEDEEQITLADYLDAHRIPYYAVPNGGKREKRKNNKGVWYSPAAVKLKAMGVKAGVPDLVIVVARGGFHGFYLELKRREGWKIEENQLEWRKTLLREGYWHEFAYGCDDAIRKIDHYLKLPHRER